MFAVLPRRALAGLALWCCLSCAGGPTGGSPEPPSGSGSRHVLTRSDLEAVEDLDAFEAVRRLRPSWLRYRGQSVLTGPHREGLRVYLDGTYFGDADALSRLQPPNLEELRFLDSRQATLRFGTGHTVGAILATTRRQDV